MCTYRVKKILFPGTLSEALKMLVVKTVKIQFIYNHYVESQALKAKKRKLVSVAICNLHHCEVKYYKGEDRKLWLKATATKITVIK